VDEPPKEVASVYGTMAARSARLTHRIDRRAQVKSAVGSLTVVVLEVDIEHSLHVRTPEDEHPIQALSRTVRTHRSAKALARGARMGVQITWAPSVRKTSSKLETYFESRSLMRKRKATLSPG
jgi:hypothetical protein